MFVINTLSTIGGKLPAVLLHSKLTNTENKTARFNKYNI